MLQIQNTLVSLDLVERFFCCDLAACKGQCCLEGDAGAPVTPQEDARIKELLPLIDDLLLPAAKRQIAECGTSYRDPEGELVTQLVENRNCVFATLDEDGTWICALEKACRQGRTDFLMPSVSRKDKGIPHIHRRELRPLENMPWGGSDGARPRNPRLPVSRRASAPPFRR